MNDLRTKLDIYFGFRQIPLRYMQTLSQVRDNLQHFQQLPFFDYTPIVYVDDSYFYRDFYFYEEIVDHNTDYF